MRTPKTLPQVPTDDELRAVLTACLDTLWLREGMGLDEVRRRWAMRA